jgi:hypothetical protein
MDAKYFKSAGEYNSNTYYQFWRQDIKPIEVYNNTVIDKKLDYLPNNPVIEGIVEQSEDYIYSSVRDYAGQKGMLEIELL